MSASLSSVCYAAGAGIGAAAPLALGLTKRVLSSPRAQEAVYGALTSPKASVLRLVECVTGLGAKVSDAFAKTGRAAGLSLPALANYETATKNLQEALAQPDRLQQFAQGQMEHLQDSADTAEVATAGSVQMLQALQYLQTQLPSPPPGLAPGPGETPWQPSAAAKSTFLDKMRGVLDPASVAAHPTQASMDAMRAVNPQMAQYIASRLLDKISKDPKITYNQKIQCSKLLGSPVSSLTSPEFGATIQGVLSGVPVTAQGGQQTSARQANATRQLNIRGASADESTSLNKIQKG